MSESSGSSQSREASESPTYSGEYSPSRDECSFPTRFEIMTTYDYRMAAFRITGKLEPEVALSVDALEHIMYRADDRTIMTMRLTSPDMLNLIETRRQHFARYKVDSVELSTDSLFSDPILFFLTERKGNPSEIVEKDIEGHENLLKHFIPQYFRYHVFNQLESMPCPGEPEVREVPDLPIPKQWYKDIHEVEFKVAQNAADEVLPILSNFTNIKHLKLLNIKGPGKLAAVLKIMPEIRYLQVEVVSKPDVKIFTSDDKDLIALIHKTNDMRVLNLGTIVNIYSTEMLIRFFQTAKFSENTTIKLLNWPQKPEAFLKWLTSATNVTMVTHYGKDGVSSELFHPNRYHFAYRNISFTLHFYVYLPITK